MSDTGFRSAASALGARVFVAVLVFVAPILTVGALVAVAMNDVLWAFFAEAVESNIFAPYAWALGSGFLVLSLAAAIGYPVMLIARRRERWAADRRSQAGPGASARQAKPPT